VRNKRGAWVWPGLVESIFGKMQFPKKVKLFGLNEPMGVVLENEIPKMQGASLGSSRPAFV